jgi:hypothetical protein
MKKQTTKKAQVKTAAVPYLCITKGSKFITAGTTGKEQITLTRKQWCQIFLLMFYPGTDKNTMCKINFNNLKRMMLITDRSRKESSRLRTHSS